MKIAADPSDMYLNKEAEKDTVYAHGGTEQGSVKIYLGRKSDPHPPMNFGSRKSQRRTRMTKRTRTENSAKLRTEKMKKKG